MKFSYSAAWEDTVRMLKGNGSLLIALAGAFFMLPGLLIGYFLPTPTEQVDVVASFREYYGTNWPWLLLSNLVNAVGAVAIYLLLFDGRGRTVGSAIAGALPIVPLYFLLSLLVWIVVGFGLMLFILPGIYLLGRLAPSGAVMIAESRRNPFDALGKSWSLTRRNGWAVAGFIILAGVAGLVMIMAITFILGSIFLLIGGREGVGGLLVLILSSALMAALYTTLLVLIAAVYRRLKPAESSVPSTAA